MGSTTRLGRYLGAATAAVLVTSLAACSSDDPASGGGGKASAGDSKIVADAKGLVQTASSPLEWKAPGPQFSATADLTGKKFTFISVALTYQYSTALADGIKDAASLFGATVDAEDAAGDPTAASRQISTAVSSGSAGIIVQGFPSSLLAGPLQSAQQAGIPVVMVNDVEQSAPTDDQAKLGVVGNANSCSSCGGKLLADIAVAEYGSKTNALFVGANSLGVTATAEQDGFKSELARLCPDCKASYLDIGVPKWPTDVAPAVTSALSDRSVNVIAPLYDLEFPYVLSAISAAQADDRVSVMSVDGTQPGLTDLAKGRPVTGDVGSSATQLGWTAFDQALRSINDQAPATDAVLPMRAFDQEIASGLDLKSGAEESWFTDADLKSEFSKLWGKG